MILSVILVRVYKRKLGIKEGINSRFWIFFAIFGWLFCRLVYFAPSLNLNNEDDFFRSNKCMVAFSQNLPVFLMYVCILVIHRFLLRVYNEIRQKSNRRKKCNEIYIWVVFSVILLSQLTATGLTCFYNSMYTEETLVYKVKSTVIITYISAQNLAICILVFKTITYAKAEARIVRSTRFLGIMIQIALVFRYIVIWAQESLKENTKNGIGFTTLLATYCSFCELSIFLFACFSLLRRTQVMVKTRQTLQEQANRRNS